MYWKEVALAMTFGAFLGLLLFFVLRGHKEIYDCDICGQKAVCEEWTSGKAAANHVCARCRELEK